MIKILPPEEAKRIAAGEVVDRPAALVREFLDNAIDAGSSNIEVSIEEGGCKKIEVIDDGDGMACEDLELCFLTHATSKISSLNDLETATTLGFRGEALAAAQAVSRLEIISSTDGREAYRLETCPGEAYPACIERHRRTKGTTVRALNIFESIPARKKFLKREGSEAALCRQVFLDKALPFNEISFRFIQDNKLKDFLPAAPSKKERFAAAILKTDEENFLHEITVMGSGFLCAIVIGSPELYRTDRRQMFVFANGRRINDYSLIQALDYGCQGWFPNGTHPVGAVFVEIDPALADFNIHPAKREVRFKDPGAIHQAVTGGLRNFFHTMFLKSNKENFSHGEHRGTEDMEEELNLGIRGQGSGVSSNVSNHSIVITRLNSGQITDPISPPPDPLFPKYIGRLFNLFILIEKGDKLYLIDQHAAHERLLYNKFISEPIPKQTLLAPIPFVTESNDDDSFLEAKLDELSRLGIDIEKEEAGNGATGGSWLITALPSGWRMGDAATVKEILELRAAGEDFAKRWAATLACRSAIKDGDTPDAETAFALGKEALLLPDPRCPHGRPVWTEISREGLFKAVRRIE